MNQTCVRITRRCIAASAAVLALLVCTARPVAAQMAAGQVLDGVPADAMAVVKVKNLQATSAKIAKYANDLGIAAMVPQMNDPLKALEDKVKISQGLNAGGDLYIAMLTPSTDPQAEYKNIVILFPVSDYKAFLANFPDGQTDGDVTQVKMADSPEPSFVANWGAYAAVSPLKELVEKKPATSLQLTAAGQKELETKDISFYANMASVRTVLQPKLAENRQEIMSKIEDAMKKSPNAQKMGPMVHAMVDQGLNAVNVLLRDTQAATYGIAIGDDGLTVTALADCIPGSYLGNTVASIKNTTDPLLAGLPTGKYLLFGGYTLDPAMTSKLFDDAISPVVKEMTTNDPDSQGLNDYMTAAKAFLGASKGGHFGLLAPTGALGQEALVQSISVVDGDAAVMSDSYTKIANSLPAMMKSMGMPADQYKITVTPNAKTVDGVSFSSIQTVLTPDPQNPMAQQQAQMMALMYGPGGITQYAGPVGDHILAVTGVSDANISLAIAAVKSGQAPLSALEQVKKVAGSLPSNRMAEAYVPLDQIVTTGLTYAKQFGFAMPVQLPPDLPPIGETISTDASVIRGDAFIPTPLVQSIVAAGIQAFMQMNGGGGGGANGGGGL
jgi:hypothetical protein